MFTTAFSKRSRGEGIGRTITFRLYVKIRQGNYGNRNRLRNIVTMSTVSKTSSCSYSSFFFTDHSLILTGIPTYQEAFLQCIFFQCLLKHPPDTLPMHFSLLSVSTRGVRRLLCRDYSNNRYPGFGSLLQGYQALVPAHASKYLRHHLCLKVAVLLPQRSLGRCVHKEILDS